MCYAKPGNRCSGYRIHRTSIAVQQRQEAEATLAAAEAELKAAEKQPGTLHKVLERRRDISALTPQCNLEHVIGTILEHVHFWVVVPDHPENPVAPAARTRNSRAG